MEYTATRMKATPIYYAVIDDRADVVTYFLQKGARFQNSVVRCCRN